MRNAGVRTHLPNKLRDKIEVVVLYQDHRVRTIQVQQRLVGHYFIRRKVAAHPRAVNHLRAEGFGEAETVLDVRNLRKTYATGGGWFTPKRVVHAVNDVSFSVRRVSGPGRKKLLCTGPG